MILEPLGIPGACLVKPDIKRDSRGTLSRIWCREDFAALGIENEMANCCVVYNDRAGTIRGLHYQREPFAEAKLVRCLTGAIYDVVVDLRENSPTKGCWCSVELTAASNASLFIPKGCAQGYQTLQDETELLYHISTPYQPDYQAGIRWDDPKLAIEWPLPEPILSPRDRALPNFRQAA